MKNWSDYGTALDLGGLVEKLNDFNLGTSAVVVYNNDPKNKPAIYSIWGSQGDSDLSKEWKQIDVVHKSPAIIADYMDKNDLDHNSAMVVLAHDNKYRLLGYVKK